jgi:sugar lactone lactonase YvrE
VSSTGPSPMAGRAGHEREALPCSTEQTELGEGVRWDADRNELIRVDIVAGRVYRERIADDGDLIGVRTYEIGGTVGAITPVVDGDGWLLAADRGFVHLAEDGSCRTILDVAPMGTRMNDAACDADGRFWAGTLANDHRRGGGALYRLDRSGRCEQVLADLTISNGLGWSPDGRTMYLVDSGPRVVYAFDFDPVDGAVTRQHVLVALAEDEGAPDGLTVDVAGDLWIAIYDGGCVRRYSPAGELRQVHEVPAAQSTCCAFAGPGMHRLYVTTATEEWTDEQRRADPGAGRVYRFDTDTFGVPVRPFRPEPAWWKEMTS